MGANSAVKTSNGLKRAATAASNDRLYIGLRAMAEDAIRGYIESLRKRSLAHSFRQGASGKRIHD